MTSINKSIEILSSRLTALSAIMERAENELFNDDPTKSGILTARLAPDMNPFSFQIGATVRQGELLIAKLTGQPVKEFDSQGASFADLKSLVSDSIARLSEVEADESFASAETRLELPGFPTLQMSGADYVEDWLMPNFYFHFVTAYDILRSLGLTLGKADYMSHLRPRLAAAMGA